MPDKKPSLDAAYALETPEDNRALYADWAASYDETFAAKMQFLMPAHVAKLFRNKGGAAPVLDAGAGTGLVAEQILKAGHTIIDAIDISTEMLAVAASKGVYRQTIEADLTAPLPLPDDTYHAVVSSGTFTHGHVGPEALDELLRVTRPGALFVLTMKTEHFKDRGFAAKFVDLGTQITGLEKVEYAIYGNGAPGDHRDDRALIVTFKKADG